MRGWLVAVFCMLVTGAAAADSPVPDYCAQAGASVHCDRELPDVPAISAVSANGFDVLRFKGFVGFAASYEDYTTIELRRDRIGAITLTVGNGRPARRAVTTAAGPVVWNAFAALRKRLLAASLQSDERLRKFYKIFSADDVGLCRATDSLDVQSALYGHVEHFGVTDCYLAEAGVPIEALFAKALAVVRDCGGFAAALRAVCVSLGDARAVLAEAAIRVTVGTGTFCSYRWREAPAFDSETVFLSDAGNDGQSGVRQTRDAMRDIACGREASIVPQRIAASGDDVAVTGYIEQVGRRLGAGKSARRSAPYQQLWRLHGDALHLERWSLGVFGVGPGATGAVAAH